MSLTAQTKLEEFREKLYVKAKTEPAYQTPPLDACLHVKPVRELDAGNPHVQFDEGVEETDRGYDSARSTPRKRVIATGAAKPERYRASTPPLHPFN